MNAPAVHIERLPRLIERAAAALAKATTAAEVLDARDHATVAANAARAAAQFAKKKQAHAEVIAACHKAHADALAIEAAAQCRLADEYDAAQERGEVGKRGDFGGVNSRGEFTPTTKDIGLTGKEVHEARQIRDAEKAKPGIVRRTLDEQLSAGEEPSRSHVKRAINAVNHKGNKKSRPKRKAPTPHPRSDAIVALADKGESDAAIAAALGIGQRQVRHVVDEENIRREAKADPEIDPKALSLSAQEKLDAAIRQHKRRLDLEFETRVRDEVKRRIDEIVLPHWKQKIDEAQRIYGRRKGFTDKATFNLIWSALHPDSRKSISDRKLAAAFDAFSALEKYLLNEQDSPTVIGDLPDNIAAWDKMRAKHRTGRNTGKTMARTK